jgi:hypothetical protein
VNLDGQKGTLPRYFGNEWEKQMGGSFSFVAPVVDVEAFTGRRATVVDRDSRS